MIYPTNFEDKIGFSQIRQITINHCISSLGKHFANKELFSSNIETISNSVNFVDEFKQILLFENSFPSHDYYDLRTEIKKLQNEGTYLDTEELAQLRAVLKTIFEILYFFNIKNRLKYPNIHHKSSNIFVDEEIVNSIDRIINDKAEIKDKASEKLYEIRTSLERVKQDATRKTLQCIKNAKSTGLIKDDVELTLRNGRLVIPIAAANKRRLKGFIHDESASGQTLYIEPQEVIQDNNEIRELTSAERREIIQILINVSQEIRQQSNSILAAFYFLGKIDFNRAKAKIAVEMNAIKPEIEEEPKIFWRTASHPLLLLKFKKNNKELVPLDIELKTSQKIVIISGPNAGGKSVAMKTVGLIQYMLQCGYLVPVHEVSQFGVFKKFFIDMGDEQSIDNDLSTYSSHLTNMKFMLENGDENSLILIDEMGSGTEPLLGGAMAESITESLRKNGVFAVITTHFGNLKRFASLNQGIQNGAMLFDEKSMQPLFILKTGIQGSSFTFEIAKNIGFPSEIVDKAKELIDSPQYDFEVKTQQIETELIELNEQKKSLHIADQTLAEIINEYNSKTDELNREKNRIIKEAKKEANTIIKSANSLIENTIREIKESNADNKTIKTSRKKVEDIRKSLEVEIKTIEQNEKPNKPKKTISLKIDDLKPNDPVFLTEVGTQAKIVEIKKNGEVVVDINGVILRTSTSKIEPISKSEYKKLNKNPKQTESIYKRIQEKSVNFKPNIDIRGKRAEEAVQEVEKLIDDAVQLGVKELKILHGKGSGILRKIVRETLQANDFVEKFHDEKQEYGGDGISIVILH